MLSNVWRLVSIVAFCLLCAAWVDPAGAARPSLGRDAVSAGWRALRSVHRLSAQALSHLRLSRPQRAAGPAVNWPSVFDKLQLRSEHTRDPEFHALTLERFVEFMEKRLAALSPRRRRFVAAVIEDARLETGLIQRTGLGAKVSAWDAVMRVDDSVRGSLRALRLLAHETDHVLRDTKTLAGTTRIGRKIGVLWRVLRPTSDVLAHERSAARRAPSTNFSASSSATAKS